MMQSFIVPAISAVLAPISVAAAPPDEAAWRWDKDAGICQLAQKLGGSNDRLDLARPPGSDQTIVSLELKAKGPETATPTRGLIRLSDGGSLPADIVIYGHPNGSRIVSAQSAGRDLLTHLAVSNSLEIVHPKAGALSVPLVAAAAAVKALRSCEDRTLKSWGIDPVGYWALSARPLPLESPLGLFNGDDYPASAQAMGIESTVVARVDISSDGSLKSCTVLSQHKILEFKDVVCNKLRKRARFNPARDETGSPVEAPYVAIVRFKLYSD